MSALLLAHLHLEVFLGLLPIFAFPVALKRAASVGTIRVLDDSIARLTQVMSASSHGIETIGREESVARAITESTDSRWMRWVAVLLKQIFQKLLVHLLGAKLVVPVDSVTVSCLTSRRIVADMHLNRMRILAEALEEQRYEGNDADNGFRRLKA